MPMLPPPPKPFIVVCSVVGIASVVGRGRNPAVDNYPTVVIQGIRFNERP